VRNTKKANRESQCVDIEFAEPGDEKIEVVTEENCFNSTELGFAEPFTIALVNPKTGKRFGEDSAASRSATLGSLSLVVLLGWMLL
jgi:hypothetical protein